MSAEGPMVRSLLPSLLTRLLPRLLTLLAAALFAGGCWWLVDAWQGWRAEPTPETIVAASLDSLHEQNVLVPFTARYVAVVTSRQSKLGLEAEKTLIMPGTVRYEVDLAAISATDLAWNAETQELMVTLPPIRLAGPEIDMAGIREFRDGEVLMFFTDAEQRLDAANRAAAMRALLAQARGETPLRLARGAAIRAVEQNFALPLAVAGMDATVRVRFRQE